VPAKIQPDGSFEIEYVGPYGGLHVQAPENLIAPSYSPSTRNFMFRNAELRSRPAFLLKFPAPDPLNPVLGQTSFLDVNSVFHTVAFTSRGLWQLAPAGQPPGSQGPWQFLGGPSLAAGNPVTYRSFASLLYYTNGGPFLSSWDGIAAGPVVSVATISSADAPTVVPGSTGPLNIGGFYIGELDNHILLANVVVQDANGVLFTFPQRLWWSANGIPNVWDPVANTNAGFNDFLDVPDLITGMVTLGIAGYIFRTNGITFFTPTGNGMIPFQFDHLWGSNRGIGNIYPWSVSSYGSFCCFISIEQIYQMSVNSFSEIGGSARDSLAADLASTTGNPVAAIIPTFGLGYVYLVYLVSIPLGNFTRHYVYSLEDKNWAVWDTSGTIITGKPDQCWVGMASGVPAPGFAPVSSKVGGSGGGGGGGGGGGNPPPPSCPADDQIMETKELGFVPAYKIVAGMHVRGWKDEWNLVSEAFSVKAYLHYVLVGEETYHVDLDHRWLPFSVSLDADMSEWLRSGDLKGGEILQGADGKPYPVMAVSEKHEGLYRKIICAHQRMRIGKVVAHNASTTLL
jgi:hypothetical protein